MYILTIYASISLFTALLHGVYWLRCKHKIEKPVAPAEMLLRAVMYALIWPIFYWFMLRERDALHLLNKAESFTPKLDDVYVEQRARQWQELIANLPICGTHLIYKGRDIYSEPLPGTFMFESDTLTAYVCDAIGRNNTEQDSHERVLYRRLVGHGEVFCHSCRNVFSENAVSFATEGAPSSKGWILEALYCPNQHLLLRNKTIHFYSLRRC